MTKPTPYDFEYYEGLVRKTASRYVNVVEEEYEDICQILRLKAWRAIETFDPSKSNLPIQRYVFSCIRNQVKDLLKRKRRHDLHIEDIAPVRGLGSGGDDDPSDRFEARYMTTSEDEVYAEVLADTPLIPSTLDDTERKVLVCMYLDYQQRDIATSVGVSMREVARTVKAIKEKMADWKPSANGTATSSTTDKGAHIEHDDQESVPQP